MKDFIYGVSTTKHGNMSFKYGNENEVNNNRKIFLSELGIRLEDCASTWVQGEDEIAEVVSADKGKMFKVDALVTSERDLGLFMVTADCFPVVIHDPIQKNLAMMHLGRAGANKKLVLKTIKLLTQKYKSQIKDMQVIIGPGIRKESYLFKDVTQKDDPEWKPYLNILENGMTSVDLAGFIKNHLIGAGIPTKNITDCGIDTAKDKNYFSHYRSVRSGEPEGRFATVVLQRF